MSAEPNPLELLDVYIDALLRGESWRDLVKGPLDPELERLMLVAESLCEDADETPRPGQRQRLRVWDRVFGRRERAGSDPVTSPAPGLLSLRRITGDRRPPLPHRRWGALDNAPAPSSPREEVALEHTLGSP